LVTTVLSTGRIGTFGQSGLGVLGQIADCGWSSFVRGDYRTGWAGALQAAHAMIFNPENGPVIQGRSADIAGAPVAPPPYKWSGFYVGVSAPGALGVKQSGHSHRRQNSE
jgi:hypothetical protein